MANPANFSAYSALGVQVNYSLASQSIPGNYSVINWNIQLVVTSGGGSGSSSFSNWNFQYPTGTAIASGNAGSVTINSGSQPVIASGQFVHYHNADGTSGTINIGGYAQLFSGIGSATATASFTVATIPRYAAFSSISSSAITDVSFTINFTTDSTCDRYAISLDNGSTYADWVNGDFTSISTSAGSNLLSDNTYSWKVKVRRKDSQLETVSSTQTATTLPQSNFAVWGIL